MVVQEAMQGFRVLEEVPMMWTKLIRRTLVRTHEPGVVRTHEPGVVVMETSAMGTSVRLHRRRRRIRIRARGVVVLGFEGVRRGSAPSQ